MSNDTSNDPWLGSSLLFFVLSGTNSFNPGRIRNHPASQTRASMKKTRRRHALHEEARHRCKFDHWMLRIALNQQ
jgi:hypothetical protein